MSIPSYYRKGNNKAFCCVPGCNTNALYDRTFSFHLFPKKGTGKVELETKLGKQLIDRRLAWIIRTGIKRKVSPYMQVCSKHFKPTDFCRKERLYLLKTAVPSLNLPKTKFVMRYKQPSQQQSLGRLRAIKQEMKSPQGDKMRLKYTCKFPNCKNGYYQTTDPSYKNKRFYRFPRPNRRETLDKWKQVCNIKEDSQCAHSLVCQDHFLPSDFVNETSTRINYQVVPKDVTGLLNDHLDDNVTISGDHTYNIKSQNTEDQNKENTLLDNDTVMDSEPRNLTTQTDDIYDSDDQTFSESYAKIKYDHPDLYSKPGSSTNYVDLAFLHYDKYDFLLSPFQSETENSTNAELADEEYTPSNLNMNMIHTNLLLKLEKLYNLISQEKEPCLKVLLTLCKKGLFRLLLKNIGWLTDTYSHPRLRILRNSGQEWDTPDTRIALYLYKQGTLFYRYLSSIFILPSLQHLERIYRNIAFNTGLDPSIISTMKSVGSNMDPMDTYCYLAFDEMVLAEDLVYDSSKQLIYGYKDMGHLGRSHLVAKYALVFMVCGLRKPWKQIVAYYFLSHIISNDELKQCIREIISQLQDINFKVVATVCKQNSYSDALYELCEEDSVEPNPFCFMVNEKPIATIFNVPELLKDTRKEFLHHDISIGDGSIAKFVFVKEAFSVDAMKKFKHLPNLKKESFTDEIVDLSTAKAQFSSTVAASIETLVVAKIMMKEAIETADFINIISDIYDSLGSEDTGLKRNKRCGCVLSETSSHIEFWLYVINVIDKWKADTAIIGNTNSVSLGFIKGWQSTIKSVSFVWNSLREVGFTNLNLKLFDQQPMENVFHFVKKFARGFTENPSCFKFVNALKQFIIEECLFLSPDVSNQYKDPFPLCNLAFLWIEPVSFKEISQSEPDVNKCEITEKFIVDSILNSDDLKEIKACCTCKNSLFSCNITNSLYLVNNSFIVFLSTLSDKLFKCLARYSYKDRLVDRFKEVYLKNNTVTFCESHSLEASIVDTAVPLLIHRFVKEFNQSLTTVSKKYSNK